MTSYDQLAADNGPAVTALRNLQLLRAAGVLSEQDYQTAYRALVRANGRPCDRCGTPPAGACRGSAIYCARCYQETA